MKVFAITVVHNEGFFLPRWIAYYSAQLGAENLFVIDHGSTDNSTTALGRVNVIRVPREGQDDVQRVQAVTHLHASLLQYYDAGFVSDADEFLVADPASHANLADFAAHAPAPALACVGLELYHDRRHEPDFSPALPVLAQRQLVMFDSWMCKRSFASKPVRFGGGFHTSDQPVVFADDLYMIHLKNFDYRFRLARQRITASWKYAGNYGEHARKELDYVEQVFGQVDDMVLCGQVSDSFDFTVEIARCMQRTELNPSGEYDFNLRGGVNSPVLHRLPRRLLGLF